MKIETAYVNGRIYTVDPDRPWATAVGIAGGTFALVGNDDDIMSAAAAGTDVVDLDGAFVLPGMGDMHQHWDMSPLQTRSGWFQWTGGGPAPRPAQLKEALLAYAGTNPDIEWVIGATGSWHQQFFEEAGEVADAAWLDAVIPDRPVALQDVVGHSMLVNTMAMRVAGLRRDVLDPANGTIRRDAAGNPVGVFCDGAQTLVMGPWPLPSPHVHIDAFADCAAVMSSLGLTMVRLVHSRRASLEALHALDEQGGLPLWLDVAISWKDDIYPVPERWDWLAGERFWYRSEHVNPHSVKWHHDGTSVSRTASTLQPYAGTTDWYGKLHMTFDETVETIEHLDSLGIRVVAHSTADGSARHLLDAFEEVRRRRNNSRITHTIAHCIVIDPADTGRFAELNVIAEVGGAYMYRGIRMDQHITVLGERVEPNLFPVRQLVDAGATVVPGSDLTIGTSPAPLEMIENYLTRRRPTRSLNKLPENSDQPLGRGISLEQALRIVTINCAIATGTEYLRGSITPGKSADFVVLDHNLFDVPANHISQVNVTRTVFQGREVWNRHTMSDPFQRWGIPVVPGICDCTAPTTETG